MTKDRQPTCPRCGELMIVIAAGPPGIHHSICPHCQSNGKHHSGSTARPTQIAHQSSEEPHQRFRRLLRSNEASKSLRLPAWLIDDLPEGARRLLAPGQFINRQDVGPLLSDSLVHDPLNLAPGNKQGRQGVQVNGSRYIWISKDPRRCPNCDAGIPSDRIRCDWCGTPVE